MPLPGHSHNQRQSRVFNLDNTCITKVKVSVRNYTTKMGLTRQIQFPEVFVLAKNWNLPAVPAHFRPPGNW
jgi:hypothetical protein